MQRAQTLTIENLFEGASPHLIIIDLHATSGWVHEE